MSIIVHNVARKDKAAIGTAELSCPLDGWVFNGAALPCVSAEFLVHYGLKQYLADSYASATNLEQAQGLYAKRCDKLLLGTVGVRESGGFKAADDPVEKLAVKNAKEALFVRFDAKRAKDGKAKAAKISDYMADPAIAKYFKAREGKFSWIDGAVIAWMDGPNAGKDFRVEAGATLNSVAIDLDF